jgi:hypothetical protein
LRDITSALRISTIDERRIRLVCAVCGDMEIVALMCYPAVQRKLDKFRNRHAGTCSKASGDVGHVRTLDARSVA